MSVYVKENSNLNKSWNPNHVPYYSNYFNI